MRYFIYTETEPELRARIQEALEVHGEVLFYDRAYDKKEVPHNFIEADFLMGNPPLNWFGAPLPALKFWQLDSAGFDQYKTIRVQAAVANMGDFFSRKCAETMVGGILAFYRLIHELVRLQSAKQWVGKPLRYRMDMLSGKNVILVGAGSIAREIKNMLGGFGCIVKYAARQNPAAEIKGKEELRENIGWADVVINTLPGAAGTFFTEDLISSMKEGAVYGSVGRGTTTDETALISALKQRHLAGAVLDVTEKEPLPLASPLWEMPNVILTQHSGGGHRLEDEGKAELFIENVRRFREQLPLLNRIDLGRGY
jgi:glyoxylate/hydroxypyruvate reductase